MERGILLNVLALDTAGSHCGVGILRNDGRQFFCIEPSEQSHSRCILQTVENLLHEAALSLTDLQLLIWNAGPGSFTGIRIAASVVQSLSYSLQIPFLSLSSLEILAYASVRAASAANQWNAAKTVQIKVAVDARMNGVYWASFIYEQGALRYIEEDRLISREEFAAQRERVSGDTLIAGDAWPLAAQGAIVYARIDNVMELGQMKPLHTWQHRAQDCLPHYVQSSINWQKRTRFQTS